MSARTRQLASGFCRIERLLSKGEPLPPFDLQWPAAQLGRWRFETTRRDDFRRRCRICRADATRVDRLAPGRLDTEPQSAFALVLVWGRSAGRTSMTKKAFRLR